MSLLDPAVRTATGERTLDEILGIAISDAPTLFEESVRDFAFAEVWTRPGLDRRSRMWITLASVGVSGLAASIEVYVEAALRSGEITLAELREFVLHFAVYCGWPRASVIDAAVTRAAATLGLPPVKSPPIRAAEWDADVRIADGQRNFDKVMTFPGPPPTTAYYGGGIMNFVFGEMWMRPGLDQRARRWVTLACVGDSGAQGPVLTHVYAAMKSGDATLPEMQEFVLQFALYCGWPKGSVMQGAVDQMGERVAKGLSYA